VRPPGATNHTITTAPFPAPFAFPSPTLANTLDHSIPQRINRFMIRRPARTTAVALAAFALATAPALAQNHPAPTSGGQAADVATGEPQPEAPRVPYWDNWTDSQGISHLTKCTFTTFNLRKTAPGADKMWLGHTIHGAATVMTNVQPAHWKGGWHQNPHVQWIVPTSGTLFVQAMDGTRVELNAGDALLGEDFNTTKDKSGHAGHLSGNVGDAPVTLLITQFDNAIASHKPCLAH